MIDSVKCLNRFRSDGWPCKTFYITSQSKVWHKISFYMITYHYFKIATPRCTNPKNIRYFYVLVINTYIHTDTNTYIHTRTHTHTLKAHLASLDMESATEDQILNETECVSLHTTALGEEARIHLFYFQPSTDCSANWLEEEKENSEFRPL